MRLAAALTLALMLSVTARAQGIPVGGDQSVDVAVLLQLLGPVIQSLEGSANASLDDLSLTSVVGAGDVTQFSRLFESVGFDGEMTTLLSSLSGLGDVDFSSLAQLAGAAGGVTSPAGPGSATAGLAQRSSVRPPRTALARLQSLSAGSASPSAAVRASASRTTIHRSTETINGRPLQKYSNLPPRNRN